MTLTNGEKLGTYEILSPLGAGGMGEVYRARDTKLGREVAIKVLPEEFTEHPEKLARFEREARLLAALNHPKIATLYGVEESQTQPFLVMELVEGETLADRIASGPIPFEEALAIAHQIAEALEAAHEKGVIHRDLKPANIKVDAEGNVKVLDFGLAKAFAGDDEAQAELSQSPTLSRDATRAGVILGTAAYMSPEQAKGKAVDKRTDIFSFGIVLYEMLTGRKAFKGEDVPDILAGIINKDPDWKPVDPRVQHLLRRCLRKDRKKRLRDIGDARNEIEECLAEPALPPGKPRRSTVSFVAIAAVAGLTVGVAVWTLMRPGPAGPRQVKRLSIVLPPSDDLIVGAGVPGNLMALSPDGQKIVYVGTRNGMTQLILRPIDRLETVALRGTENARQPFFSPDGQWIGFFADRQLKKVSVSGGPPVTVCDYAFSTFGGAWGTDDVILFGAFQSGLLKVPAGGGVPEPATKLDPGSGVTAHRWPEFLPGGRAFLYTSVQSASKEETNVVAHSLETGEERVLIEGASDARYVSSGQIVFTRENSLLAAPLDLDRLELSGSPVPIPENVQQGGGEDLAQFSLSREGTLAYLGGDRASQPGSTLVRVNRQGVAQPVAASTSRMYDPRISPDGRRVAVSRDGDIWTLDLERGTWSRITLDSATDVRPVWSRDGRTIFFASNRSEDAFNIFSKPADGSGVAQQRTTGAYRVPVSLSPDGKILVFRQVSDTTGADIGNLRLESEAKPETLLQTPFEERCPNASPDGHWLTYVSNESGRDEVYMMSFPEPGTTIPVSTEGGAEPLWSPAGRELFYRLGNKMMTVSVALKPEVSLGKPEPLFEGRYLASTTRQYDVTADGQSFFMIQSQGDSSLLQIHVVLDWQEELKRLAPTN